jgi:glycosyltransferase involved in cell wall biosynthesis
LELPSPPTATVVLPVYNEAAQVVPHAERLRDFLDAGRWAGAEIVIADNGSTDATPRLARELAERRPGLRYLRREPAGRGGALREAWLASPAPLLAYTDVDLSTALEDLAAVLAAVADGRADVALGSRLAPGARVTRSWRREVLSRGYNRIVQGALGLPVRDAQCGCKALTRAAARTLLPQVADDGWFFDTELLVLAHRAGLRLQEVPVRWVDDPDTRVKLLPTILGDLRGIRRLWRELRERPARA